MSYLRLLYISIFFSLLLTNESSAGKEYNIWYFGNHAGLNFNSGEPVELTDGALSTAEGSATVSDKYGNLLFYTDGVTVYNKDHQMMLNGDSLRGNRTSAQSALIAKKPGSRYLYYIFTTTPHNIEPNTLYYSIVDIRKDNGNGAILTDKKNIRINDNSSERLSGTLHANGRDIWIVTHMHNQQRNEYRAYLLTDKGLALDPVISIDGFLPESDVGVGTMCFSPNSLKGVIVFVYMQQFEVFKFDPESGNIYDVIRIDDPYRSNYGAAFSPNSDKLYVTHHNGRNGSLICYDLSIYTYMDIPKSAAIIYDDQGCKGIKLGPDDVIYCTNWFNSIAAVRSPDEDYDKCDFDDTALYLDSGDIYWDFPSRPLISRYFEAEITGQTEYCQSDTITLSPVLLGDYGDCVYTWSELDGKLLSTGSQLIINGIPEPGEYYYTLEVTEFDHQQTSLDTFKITVHPSPIADAGESYSICLGDTVTIGTPTSDACTWTPDDGLEDSKSPTPLVSPDESMMYYLTVRNAAGCEDYDSVYVEVNDIHVEIGNGMDTLDFNTLCPNVASEVQLYIQNLSTVQTGVSRTITEPVFTLTDNIAGVDLDPGERRYFRIHFNPQSIPGKYEGQFTIIDECGEEHSIYLIAEVKDIEYSIPATVDFGEICPGEIGDFQFDIQNMTDGVLDFEIELDRDDLFELPPADIEVGANSSDSVTMKLKTNAPRGIQIAYIKITDPCDEVRTIEITVDIKDIKFALQDTLDFGLVCSGDAPELNLQASNISDYDSELISLIASGDSKFSIISDYSETISKGTFGDAVIGFSADFPSLYIDSVLIRDDCGNENTVYLKARSVKSQISIETIGLTGTIYKSEKFEKDIVFRNSGETDVIITNAEIDPPFLITSIAPAINQTIAPGEIVTVSVEYQSTEPGTFSTNLRLSGTELCTFAETADLTAIVLAPLYKTDISIACPADTKDAGEDIFAPIIAGSAEDVNNSGSNKFEIKLEFDATVLYPTDPDIVSCNYQDGKGELLLSCERTDQTSELKTVRFIAALGEQACSDLEITEFRWLDGDCDVDALHSGCLCVNICRSGGDRLIKISKTPVRIKAGSSNSGTIDIEYELIETGAVLEITDVYGRSRNIIIEQTKGLHNVSVDTLAAGVYIVSLRASGILLVSKVVVW
ncbi:MAG: hypothetical protein PF588_03660 [Candidatus Kapabacteria bacterium]|jgi:hypothetical protein|nr:hypothetical protein [Candidatus Kapabacteria bacterium]